MKTLKKINTVTTVAKQSTTDIQAINAEKVEKHYQLIRVTFERSVKQLLQTAHFVYDAKQTLNKESFKALAKRFGSKSTVVASEISALLNGRIAAGSTTNWSVRLSRQPRN